MRTKSPTNQNKNIGDFFFYQNQLLIIRNPGLFICLVILMIEFQNSNYVLNTYTYLKIELVATTSMNYIVNGIFFLNRSAKKRKKIIISFSILRSFEC